MTDIFTGLFDGKIFASQSEKTKVWDVRPFQLVSLLDMEQFYAHLFIQRLLFLEVMVSCTSHPDYINSQISDVDKKAIVESIEEMAEECQKAGLEVSAEYLRDVGIHIEVRDFTYSQFHPLIHEMKRVIDLQMKKELFMRIPQGKAGYYNQQELFGAQVNSNFPSTANDIIEAGNCYAAGRNTACVFHCMRVLEKGLHALVRELNSTFSTNINFSRGVEHTNWGVIIDKIESEIRELLKPTRQPRLTPSDLQFYSEAAKEFVYFKNAWRDEVSHSRSTYGEGTAKDVLEHVHAFMQHLASRLHE